MIANRTAGVLLHPTSLPGRYGVGDFGEELVTFLDWVQSAGLHLWQILPLNPPGYGNSPYGCHSSYAGNPLLISPARLKRNGLLPDDALDDAPDFSEDHVDFDAVTAFKNKSLRRSWDHFNSRARKRYEYELRRFEEDNAWLEDWATYASLKERYGGSAWIDWPHDIATRDPAAIA
ncbi:MAG TPA: 4-alpha-glucanotransferase, partial [Thermoanaerobaculia bacterium]|nr:4-alpha-glucanotransferase [Thermoanaerobaculia bacterium]